MSDFHELIKNFPKTREYVRDFFVYGFKSRNEFKDKSPRTYDNERRRLESWLGPYVQKDYASNGSNISLAIDSSLLDTNPLFRVWKTKSFTDNDIVLHFLILDLLRDGKALTVEAITDGLLRQYKTLFDIQTVRRKCNAYEKEGLLQKEKRGKTVVYSLNHTLTLWLRSNGSVLDALDFFQMAAPLGIIADELSEQLDHRNRTFRVKHSFFVHTLEDEVLLALLSAMNQKSEVQLKMKGSKNKAVSAVLCVPLQIFVSTRSGRRFLCGYLERNRRFTCFRLDTVKQVLPTKTAAEYDILLEKLDRNRSLIWGVSFQNNGRRHTDTLTMTIQAADPEENYIVDRLKREGRGGTVTQTAPGVYTYETRVFDCNEMLPWLRTFTGRILSLTCSDPFVERLFFQDLQAMYQLYQINGGGPGPQA